VTDARLPGALRVVRAARAHGALRFPEHPVLSSGVAAAAVLAALFALGPDALHRAGDAAIWFAVDASAARPETAWMTYAGVESAANVLMFVPIGLALLLLVGRRRWWIAPLLGVAMTCAVEAIQLVMPDRVSDVRDIVANSAGALVGVLLGLAATARARRRAPRGADGSAATTASDG
jgi:VanZ family protein